MTTEDIVNKQFEMIGESFRYKDITEDGLITVGKKKILWYEYYKFRDEAQYLEWRQWAWRVLQRSMPDPKRRLDRIDFEFGLTYKIPKEKGQGELF